MKISFDFIAITLLGGAAQGLLLALALLTIPRGNRAANRILAALLFLFAVSITLQILSGSNDQLGLLNFAQMQAPLVFLCGPLFYFYVFALTRGEIRVDGKRLSHLLPAIGAAISLSFFLQSAGTKITSLVEEPAMRCQMCEIILWLALAHLLVYLIATIVTLRGYARAITQSFSSLEKINLNWLRYLLILFAVDWVAACGWQLFGGDPATANYIWLWASLAMYAIGYMGLRQPEIFSGNGAAAFAAEIVPKKKYEKSTLAPAKAEEYHRKLLELMTNEKPHRNCDLTLPKLAQRLAVSTHHLSQIINERFQQNFFEFVNRHRVEAAQQMLRDPAKANLNIAEIGFDAGFSSISAFNTAFKKHTGMTPSQFRKQQVVFISRNAA